MNSPDESVRNPIVAAHSNPHWAELIRRAGDRAAILFGELRQRISRIDGLEEDLHDYGDERGWAPRYRVGEQTLFIAHLLPGRLEARIELNASLKQSLLNSPRISAGLKETIRNAAGRDNAATLRLWISNRADARAFAQLIVVKAKLLAALPRLQDSPPSP